MKSSITLTAIFLLVAATPEATSSRILGVFPHIGKSHFFVFEPLMKALAQRGHDVHVISHFPQAVPVPNYHDISVAGTVTAFQPVAGVSFQQMYKNSLVGIFQEAVFLGELGLATCEAVLQHPPVQELLQSDEKFDLVILELFNSECFLGFAHKFRAPHIAVSSCLMMPWANDRFGNPDNPSYIPSIMGSYSDHLTFYERAENTFLNVVLKTVYHFMYSRPAQEVVDKYFGPDAPAVGDLATNTSLMLVNSHTVLNKARPFVPNVVEVGGIHVRPMKKLEKDLDAWMSEASHGVVFFSMGSMLRAETLPAVKLAALLAAFRELPQRVLWKWEGDTLPGQPDNVRVAKWLPQRDILGHPNVKLFMTHCGLLGVIEAAVSGVPMVGSPIYGDQVTNFKALQDIGVAVKLEYETLTKESVLNAIRTVLNNASYSDNAARLSRKFLDRPSSPMETAIFWIEYVIRHNGAQHLRSAAVHLTWYQYLLLDVSLLFVLTLVLNLVILRFVGQRLCDKWRKKQHNDKKQLTDKKKTT